MGSAFRVLRSVGLFSISFLTGVAIVRLVARRVGRPWIALLMGVGRVRGLAGDSSSSSSIDASLEEVET